MTVLAYDGRSVCSDGLEVCGTQITNTTSKKVFVVDGHIIACTGNAYDNPTFLKWFERRLEDGVEYPKLSENFNALVVDRDGKLTVYYEGNSNPVEIRNLPFAAGSGGDIALGAMLAGQSAREAVQTACKRDVFCGGDLTEFFVRDLVDHIPSSPVILNEDAIISPMSATLRRVDVVRAEEEAAKAMVALLEPQEDLTDICLKIFQKFREQISSHKASYDPIETQAYAKNLVEEELFQTRKFAEIIVICDTSNNPPNLVEEGLVLVGVIVKRKGDPYHESESIIF